MNTYSIPYLDLSVKDPELKAALLQSVEKVLDHGRIITGPEHQAFEEKIARYCEREHAIGMGSGTKALYLALLAMDIQTGDEVITTPLTWVATTNAITLTGATPVFVDVEDDLNINADLIEAAITPRTKAILPVHFTGQVCDMSKIMDIAHRHDLMVIEDAAQAFGARYEGHPAGSFGHAGCFSMNPMKTLNAYGEAGAVVTDSSCLRDRLLSLRHSGVINREDCHQPSINARLDTIQAAMLLVSLKYVQNKIDKRRKVAKTYQEEFEGILDCTQEKVGRYHCYYNFNVFPERREDLIEFLSSKGVETKIQHPLLMTQHTAYKGQFDAHVPLAEKLVKRLVSIPAHENMTSGDIEYVASCVREFHGVK